MDRPVRLAAIEAARSLLTYFRRDYPAWQDDQLPIEQLTVWLGCEVATFHPDDYPAGTYGFLEPGEALIWLSRDLSPTLRRFTLAHELGHVLLHSHLPFGHDLPELERVRTLPQVADDSSIGDACQIEDVQEAWSGLASQQQVEEMLGPGASYDPRSQRELAANLFAAELLMPVKRVWELYVDKRLAPDLLATRFNVSQSALLNRLAGLLAEPSSAPDFTFPTLIDAQTLLPVRSLTDAPTSHKAYDEFQRAAIEARAPALVVAGPGSGKTSTLIGRAEYLLRQQHVRPQHILALTFSRKAAQEMQERLQQILPSDQPAPTISTFHAFCAELLRTHGEHVGLRPDFALIDDAEGYFLLHSLADRLPLRHYQNLHNPAAHFLAFLKAISRAKDELITPAHYRALAEQMRTSAQSAETELAAASALEVATVYALYQQRLAERGDSDFGGLLMSAVQLLDEHSSVRAEMEQRYQHILVDEFQDINRASGVLLRALAGQRRQVWVVGDANQAIYGFRGASPANISRFQDDYPEAQVLPLSRNYRSRPDIVALSDTFRRGILEQDPTLAAVQTARASASEAYVTLAVAPNERSELLSLVRDVQAKLHTGYRARDIVVLCRTRALVRKVTHALAEAELPVVEHGGFLEQEHIKNLLSLLLLLGDESGMGILRVARLAAHPLSASDVEALLLEARVQQTPLLTLILREEVPPSMSSAGSAALVRLATVLRNLYRGADAVWSVLARYILSETTLGRELLDGGSDAQTQARRDDYLRLLQYARAYDQQLRARHQQTVETAIEAGEEPPPLPGLREQIQGFLAYFQILLSLRQDGDDKRSANAEEPDEVADVVRVMTVHASKGLEFPVVYLPGLAQGRFPLQRRANTVPPPIGMLPAESEGLSAHESGEACLFYVGTTRARDQLILSYSERYGKLGAKRSGYIDALVVGLPDERVRRVSWQSEQTTHTEDSAQVDEPPFAQPAQDFIDAMQPHTLRDRQIEEYQGCPRRYAYSSIYRFQGADGAFRPFWQATSETIKTLVERLSAGEQVASQEQAAAIFAHHWQAGEGVDQPFSQLYKQHGEEISQQIWQKMVGEQQGSAWKLRHKLTVELAGRSIEVAIDRVEAAGPEGEPTKFVRTRFGKSKTKPTPGIRELLYMQAKHQHHPTQEIALEAHNLSTGETHTIKLTERKAASLYSEAIQALEGIERQDYTPRPDAFVCPTCPFYLICPA